MIYINPDFRTRLDEVRRKGNWRFFRRIPAGPYWLSIQASGKVVQTLYVIFLVLGPELYREAIARGAR